MNNKSPTQGQKIGISILVIGLLVSVPLLMIVWRDWQEMNKTRTEVNQMTEKLIALEGLAKERVEVSNRFESLTTFFPIDEEDVAAAVQRLETIANSTGIKLILTFDDFPADIDIGGQYHRGLGINVIVEGRYQAVLSWVRGIQQLPYFIRFSELKMGVLQQGTGIRAEFEGVFFLQDES